MKKLFIALSISSLLFVLSCSNIDKFKSTRNSTPKLPDEPFRYYEDDEASNKLANLGRVLFYDNALSANTTINCGSCHKQELSFSDNVALSEGFGGQKTLRNSQPLVGLQSPFFWDGRAQVLDEQVIMPIQDHVEMGINDLDTLMQRLNSKSYYQELFSDFSQDINPEFIGKALGTFINAIDFTMPNNNQEDVKNSISPSAQIGKKLFEEKYHCNSCHLTISSTNDFWWGTTFANIGLDQENKDTGRDGEFKAPTLVNLERTAPYMHDGRFKTLEEVIDHYSNGIKNNPMLAWMLIDHSNGSPKKFNFTKEEKKALLEFLKEQRNIAPLYDIKFSDPFLIN